MTNDRFSVKYFMNEKIKQFKKRNRRRNAHLYQSGLTEKIDYILCPVSKERMSMIKSSYIERVLLITVTEYDALYPGVRGVLTYDYNKAKSLYKHRKFVTYYVWQSTQDNDIKELLCLLKTQNTKF